MTFIIWLKSWGIDIMIAPKLSQAGHAGFYKSLNSNGKCLSGFMANEPSLSQTVNQTLRH
jgi:hypothetical protein